MNILQSSQGAVVASIVIFDHIVLQMIAFSMKFFYLGFSFGWFDTKAKIHRGDFLISV